MAAGDPVGTESTLSNWIGPYVTDFLARAKAVADKPYAGYEGPLTAGPDALETAAAGKFNTITNTPFSSGTYTSANTPHTPGTYTSANTPYTPGTYTSDNTPYTPGTYTSDNTPYEQGAYTSSRDPYTATAWGDSAGGINAAANPFEARSYTDPGMASKFMNPYIMESLTPQLTEAARAADLRRMQDSARLSRAGAYGGTRQAVMEEEANRNLLQNMSDITGRGFDTAYTEGRGQFNKEEEARYTQYSDDIQRLMDQYNIDEDRAMELYDSMETRDMGQWNRDEDRRYKGYTDTEAREYGIWGDKEAALEKKYRDDEKFDYDTWDADQTRLENKFRDDEAFDYRAWSDREGNLLDKYAADETRDMGQWNRDEDRRYDTFEGDRRYGLDAIADMMKTGATLRGIDQAGMDADRQQFEEERGYDANMVQYLQSMIQGLPVGTNTQSYMEPSKWAELLAAIGNLGGLTGVIKDD